MTWLPLLVGFLLGAASTLAVLEFMHAWRNR